MMGGVFLQIDYCEFPDDVLYDIENNVWIKLDDKKHARIGITSVHSIRKPNFTFRPKSHAG
jgi:hypothetical protein